MSLSELIPQGGVIAALNATSKKQLFHDLSARAGEIFDIDAREIYEAVLEREKLGSTGLGLGVAVPHARMDTMAEVRAIFARLTTPIDFDALDDRPVDLVFLLLAPEDAGAEHLRALARITRTLKKTEYADRLRGAVGEDAVSALLEESATVDAAASGKAEKAGTLD